MAYSQATLVRQVRDILGEDIKWQTLATVSSGSDTTADVTDGTDWDEGNILEWQSDGDQAYVQSVATNTLTVIRGVNGTTGATHTSEACTKDPTYPYIKVVDAINFILNGLWPWAWKTVEASVNPAGYYASPPTAKYFDLSATAIDLVQAFQEDGSIRPNVLYYPTDGKRIKIFYNTASTSDATLATSVWFPDGFYHNTNTTYVQYRAKITDTLSSTNYADITDGNLVEVVAWGAASRLIKMQTAARLRDDARQWNVADPSQLNESAAFYEQEYQKKLQYVHDELLRTRPAMPIWKP